MWVVDDRCDYLWERLSVDNSKDEWHCVIAMCRIFYRACTSAHCSQLAQPFVAMDLCRVHLLPLVDLFPPQTVQ